jgi:transposase
MMHLLRRADEMAATATRGAVYFPRRVGELLRAGLDLRDRYAAGKISTPGLAVASGCLENQLNDLIFPPKTNAANERFARHLWAHRDELFTFLHQPGLDATNWRAELAIRFSVILRKVWGGSRSWTGARAQSVLMSMWRTCWQQGRSTLDFLSQLLRAGNRWTCTGVLRMGAFPVFGGSLFPFSLSARSFRSPLLCAAPALR